MLYGVYEAESEAEAANEADAATRVEAFVHAWAEAPIPDFRVMLKALAQWLPEILAFHRCERVSNARLEGANNKLGVLKRIAYGFVNGGQLRCKSPALVPTDGIMRRPSLVGSSHGFAMGL